MQKKPISGLGLVVVTRAEQVFKHHHTIANDAAYYSRNVFERAAVAIVHSARKEWPEHDMPLSVYNKITSKDRVEQYAHAAAFLCAAIDYIQQYNEISTEDANGWMETATNEIKDLSLFLDMSGKYKTTLPASENTGSNYQSLLKINMGALGHIINATPTGDVRNTLCDIQIHLQYLLKLLGNDNHTTKPVDNVVKSESVQDLYATYLAEYKVWYDR